MVTDGFGPTRACLQPLLGWSSSPQCLSAGSRHPGTVQQSRETGQVLGPVMGDSGSWWLRSPIKPERTGLVGDVLSVVFSSLVVIQGFANGPSQRGTEEERGLSVAEWEVEWEAETWSGRGTCIDCTLFPFGSWHHGGMGVRQRT